MLLESQDAFVHGHKLPLNIKSSYTLTFLTFSKNRRALTFYIHLSPHCYHWKAWPSEDNYKRKRAEGDTPITQTADHKVLHAATGADEPPQQCPNGIFCFRWVLLGTKPTRQGTEAGPLFMDIMQNNEAECFEISDWN